MDREIEPTAIPLPVSTAATPYSSPLSRSQRWLQGALFTSPNASPSNARLSLIEVIPPSPPRRPRHLRPIPMLPTDEAYTSPPSPSQNSIPGTPRTPGGRRTRKMMNRMSRSFHAGTPPPATRMLHPDDAKHTPISNTFLREGKRSSIVGNSPGSRRHSVASVKAPWGRDSRVLEGDEGVVIEAGEAHRLRPGIEHRETTSDETYVSQGTEGGGNNWPSSSSSSTNNTANNTPLAKAMRVDPLTALERRRRRDYTLGSHHPLRGPPNTPTGIGSTRRLSNQSDIPEEEEEVQSVEWADIVNRFRTMWRRFGDMPWIADPCVATLVIPHSKTPSTREESVPPVVATWYRAKPTLDEMLEEGQPQAEAEADDGSETLAHYGANPQGPKQSNWVPRKPPPAHHAGRDLFGDNLVIRGIVNR